MFVMNKQILLSFNVFVLMFLSVSTRRNTHHSNKPRIMLTQFKDVSVPRYNSSDPCKTFTPKMPNFRAQGRRISEVKCFEHVWKTQAQRQELERQNKCTALRFRTLVLGGKNAELGEYAHMGAVGWRGVSGKWIFKCGCSLISEKFVLTAAHCSKLRKGDTDVSDLVPKIVRLGANTIKNVDTYNVPATDGKIKRIITHPKYHPPGLYYDIAIMEFHNAIPYSWLVHPSCLESTFKDPRQANVAGWGVINLATLQTSPTLQVAEVSVIDSQRCNKLLRQKFNRNWNGTASHQICAGHLAGGIDTCQGDSGGPLSRMIPNNLKADDSTRWTVHRIIGITSFGYGCGRANSPAVYTRVASSIGWIESIVWR